MSNAAVAVGVILAAFLLYLARQDRLKVYAAMIGL